MIKFYFHPSPNPLKIALYLEETGEPYELIPVDTRKGEQHSESFKIINPNASRTRDLRSSLSARLGAAWAILRGKPVMFGLEIEAYGFKLDPFTGTMLLEAAKITFPEGTLSCCDIQER